MTKKKENTEQKQSVNHVMVSYTMTEDRSRK